MGVVHSRVPKYNMLIVVAVTTAVFYNSLETAVLGFKSIRGQGLMTTGICDVLSCTGAGQIRASATAHAYQTAAWGSTLYNPPQFLAFY
jgi:hypothetical protein